MTKSLLNITPIKPTIGAIIQDIDLNRIDEDTRAAIKQALLDYQVIFFRNQQLQPTAQTALARQFGSLHIHPVFPHLSDVPEIIVLDSHLLDLRDNELWHTDVTFSKTPPMGCVLKAVKIPEHGGDTLWASGTAAFDALEPELQEKLKTLTAEHDIRLSFPAERFARSEEEKQKLEAVIAKNPPVTHPVVRTHPETGKQALFVSEGFTSRINGLPEEEGRDLLNFLTQHAIKPEFHLRWQWQEGDVAIWDNRCTQHKALFDYGDAHRIMHRATVNGGEPYFKETALAA
ncbi:taurine dioxygenase [Neisseria zalophi]|uniref:Taurine dioxygenase n=1 Tax=Neisseria zalophi TaxID=640030 RepID=A0A5J6PU59_9NEIS|nr:taurine dioxygenase [Neisseria zalophi]QEY25844.1 taurine dioxygenase [Neisseria zalophi]